MNIRAAFRVLFYREDEILSRLDLILSTLQEIKRMNAQVSTTVQQAVDEMTAAVAAETTLDASIDTFIDSVPDLIAAAVAQAQANGATPAQLAAFDTLTQTMTANAATVKAALTANTPAAAASGT